MKKQIALIAAVNRLGYIGKEGKLMYRISEDLMRFRALTTDHVVIMGRKTYEEIGKPLPNRTIIVLTKTFPTSFETKPPHVYASTNLDDAIELATSLTKMPTIFIAGGGEVYKEAIDKADVLHLTIVDDDSIGDVMFPAVDKKKWRQASCSKRTLGRTTVNVYPYQFVRYVS